MKQNGQQPNVIGKIEITLIETPQGFAINVQSNTPGPFTSIKALRLAADQLEVQCVTAENQKKVVLPPPGLSAQDLRH